MQQLRNGRASTTAWLLLAAVALLLMLSGCGGGGPKKRVFPPQARLQELRIADDGHWQLALRIHNYSNVPMQFGRVEARLSIDGVPAGSIVLDAPLDVAANSVEVVQHLLAPSPQAAAAVRRGLDGHGVAYRLDGRIVSMEPRGDYPFEFASRLDPVPGLDGVLR